MGGGDDQLFMGAKQTPVMNAKLRIDSGQGYNDYRFGLAHATGRDRLIFVDEAFRYSRHGMGTEASWIELDGDCARTGEISRRCCCTCARITSSATT